MESHLQQQITAQIAIFGITTTIAVAAISPPAQNTVESVPVALAAQSEPLSPTPAVATVSPPGLIGQQIAFNVAFAADFLSTGAQLFARELPIPLMLAADIGSGKPVPTSVLRALRDLTAVEVDAGNALFSFSTQYVEFQAQFVAELIAHRSAGAPSTTLVRRPVGSASVAPVQLVTTRDAVRRFLTSESVRSFTGDGAAGGTTHFSLGNDFRGLRHQTDRHSGQSPSSTAGISGIQNRIHHDRHEHERGVHGD